MIHIGLFEGIGGFGLAAHWAGWKTYATCEINPFGRRVLEHYWPGAYHHGDIKTLDYGTIDVELSKRFGGKWRDDETIVTGGFPCQPFSVAGQRKGTEDDRHLWPEMLRVVREIGPDWVVGENVLGIVSWSDGLVFEQVQADLEAEGYEVQPYVLPAASVNAPHKRERVWFIAYSIGNGHDRNERTERNNLAGEQPTNTQQAGNERTGETFRLSIKQPFTNSESQRSERLQPCEQCEISQQKQEQFRGSNCQNFTTNTRLLRQEKRKQQTARVIECCGWEEFPTQPPICSGDDGFSERLDGITFPKWRKESVMAMGNAIVPQVAYQIFKTINDYERNNTKR